MGIWKKIRKIPGRKKALMNGDKVIATLTARDTYEIEGRPATEDEYCMQRYVNKGVKLREKQYKAAT